MKPPSRRVQAALEKEATLRLARFERAENWNGLMPGDPVRIAGHRGGSWRFRAHVTNTSNGASWIEVAEVLASGRRSSAGGIGAAGAADDSGGSGSGGGVETGRTMTRMRSFRPEQVTPLRRPARPRQRRIPVSLPPTSTYVPAVQVSLFDQAEEMTDEQ